MKSQILVALGASIIGLLGLAHLLLTFRGPKLLPRDRELQQSMARVAPVITDQTTIWRMWIGFNASHSLGALLFGLVYSYLVLVEGELFFQSIYLQVLGFAVLASLVTLARLYWFITPLIGTSVALLLYSLGIVIASLA